MRLYLDCDGVLADFDRGAERALGMPPRDYEKRYGLPRFWRALEETPGFYARLPELPDARRLYDAVAHLVPVVLTGVPRGGWAEAQKEAWIAEHFPGVRIITTFAARKCEHCRDGDVLVDDTLRHAQRWRDAGGVFIHHRDAETTLAELRERFPDWFAQAPQARSEGPRTTVSRRQPRPV